MKFSKKKLKAEVVRLTYRVSELEERICPCEQHDWNCINTDWKINSGAGDVDVVYEYKCKRCGKKMRSWQPFLERMDGAENG